ncbi:MAG: hypothetical protein Q9181_004080 [Wetmoreana brouardii]
MVRISAKSGFSYDLSNRGLTVVAGSLRFSASIPKPGTNPDNSSFSVTSKRKPNLRVSNNQPSVERNATCNRLRYGVALVDWNTLALILLTYASGPIWLIYIVSIGSSATLPKTSSYYCIITCSYFRFLSTATFMYIPTLAKVLSTAIALTPLLAAASPVAQHKQAPPTGSGQDFIGTLTWYAQQPDFVLATVSNNSTTHYAVLAKNNLFDDAYAFNPLIVTTLYGAPVTLVGRRYAYPSIEDNQFKDFPPGTVWERYFNMSDFMPPSSSIKTPTSQCHVFTLPPTVEALNLDNAKPGQKLADLFLSEGLTEVKVDSQPIHMNVTIAPSAATTTAAGSAQTIPAEPSGIFLAPSEQTGSPFSLLQAYQGDSPGVVDGATFQITRPATTA